MVKFLQICASQDDLFALDEEGDVYQYNFNTKTWIQLVASLNPMTAIGDFERKRGAPRKLQEVGR